MSTPQLPVLPEVLRNVAGYLRGNMTANESLNQKTKKDALAQILKDAPEAVRTMATMDEITRVWGLEALLADANTLATGEEGVDRMATNKDATEFSHTLSLHAGGQSRDIVSTVKRSVTSFGKETKGVVSTRITAIKTKGSASYADIKSFVAGRGAESL